MARTTVMLMAILLVVGIAANGSRAGPLQATSAALRLCEAPSSAACVSAVAEGQATAGRAPDPQWHWRDLFVEVAVVVARWFISHFGRTDTAALTPGIEVAFDLP